MPSQFSISIPLDTFKPDRLKKILAGAAKNVIRNVAGNVLSNVARKTGIHIRLSGLGHGGHGWNDDENKYSLNYRYSRSDEVNQYDVTETWSDGENQFDESEMYSRDIRRLESLFTDNKDALWSWAPSGTSQSEPYQWIYLTDSDDIKLAKGSNRPQAIQIYNDRVGSFMKSARGTKFTNTQRDLQKQNAFTENREWSSPIISVTRSNTTVSGIATGATENGSGALSRSSMLSGVSQYGFIRGETGNKARTAFLSKWAPSMAGTSKVQYDTPSTTSRADATWKIRPEYTSDTENVFDIFRSDSSKLLAYKMHGRYDPYNPSELHQYTPSSSYNPGGNLIRYPANSEPDPSAGKLQGKLVTYQSLMADDKFFPSSGSGLVRDARTTMVGMGTDVTGIMSRGTGYTDNLADALSKWKGTVSTNFYSGGQTTYKDKIAKAKAKTTGNSYYKDGKKQSLLDVGKLFGGARRADEYNKFGILSSKASLNDPSTKGSVDTIFFYFHDLINDVFIPFRATLTGINENTSVKWEDVQYMGRADTLFTYNGFTRDLNFAFTVYAGSVTELIPMWERVNYVSGLTRPAKYTSGGDNIGTQVVSNFIYPPLIKIRIGDLFTDQPGVITSFGLTIPDDASWETVRVGTTEKGEKYTYLENTHQEIGIENVVSRQLPTKVDISVSMRLLEKKRSMTKNALYFDATAV